MNMNLNSCVPSLGYFSSAKISHAPLFTGFRPTGTKKSNYRPILKSYAVTKSKLSQAADKLAAATKRSSVLLLLSLAGTTATGLNAISSYYNLAAANNAVTQDLRQAVPILVCERPLKDGKGDLEIDTNLRTNSKGEIKNCINGGKLVFKNIMTAKPKVSQANQKWLKSAELNDTVARTAFGLSAVEDAAALLFVGRDAMRSRRAKKRHFRRFSTSMKSPKK